MSVSQIIMQRAREWLDLTTPETENEQAVYDLVTAMYQYNESLSSNTQLAFSDWITEALASVKGGGSAFLTGNFSALEDSYTELATRPWSFSNITMERIGAWLKVAAGSFREFSSAFAEAEFE